jgi:hypothetical protein
MRAANLPEVWRKQNPGTSAYIPLKWIAEADPVAYVERRGLGRQAGDNNVYAIGPEVHTFLVACNP